jgi:tRNA nucleotidyltransferase (CCA-adding enzyme)
VTNKQQAQPELDPQKVYLVGGAVRDKLLGIKVYDKDWLVLGQTPKQMATAGFIPVGNDFPVFIHPISGEEYALARTERKTSIGYQGFEFNTSPDIGLEEDLHRRDLTINAMAEDSQGVLHDPYNGKQDLENKLLRHVSPAFVEDPVRVLRIARFAAKLGFEVAPETMNLMQTMVENGEVDALTAERVWQETEKALISAQPSRFFSVLKDCGALAKIFPEIENLFGIPQTAKYHPEIDSGIHTLMVLDQATKLSHDPVVRFAALVHDLGKASTPKDVLPSHKGHEKRGLPLIKQLVDRLRVPKKYHGLALAVAEYHLHMHRMAELRPETVLKMLEKTGSLKFEDRAEQIALCCTADARGRTGFENREYPQADLYRNYYEAANSVDSGLIAKSLSENSGEKTNGVKIKAAIQSARAAEIQKVKSQIKTAL